MVCRTTSSIIGPLTVDLASVYYDRAPRVGKPCRARNDSMVMVPQVQAQVFLCEHRPLGWWFNTRQGRFFKHWCSRNRSSGAMVVVDNSQPFPSNDQSLHWTRGQFFNHPCAKTSASLMSVDALPNFIILLACEKNTSLRGRLYVYFQKDDLEAWEERRQENKELKVIRELNYNRQRVSRRDKIVLCPESWFWGPDHVILVFSDTYQKSPRRPGNLCLPIDLNITQYL